MNERIKELKRQATRKAMWPGDPDAGELDAEKFAELIVRECAESVSYYGNRVRQHALKHFGVEE